MREESHYLDDELEAIGFRLRESTKQIIIGDAKREYCELKTRNTDYRLQIVTTDAKYYDYYVLYHG